MMMQQKQGISYKEITGKMDIRMQYSELNEISRKVVVLHNKLLKPVACFLVAISLILPFFSFFYPLEVEAREATVWLHVLTEKAGINIFDHTKVAYINMNHGPFDYLLKTAVSYITTMKPWQVTRVMVLLLPYVIFFVTWKINKSFLEKPFLATAFFSSFIYFLLVGRFGSLQYFIGRSDATAMVISFLLILATFTGINQERKIRHWSFVIGILSSLLIMTSWRSVTFIISIIGIFLGTLRYYKNIFIKDILINILFVACGAVLPFITILYFVFDLDMILYYKHFFGFFSSSSGWGLSPPVDKIKFIMVYLSGFSHYTYFTIEVIIFLVILIFHFNGKRIQNRKLAFVWLLSLLFLLSTLSYGYYLNQGGGTIGYVAYYFIMLWFGLLVLFSYLSKLITKDKTNKIIFVGLYSLIFLMPWDSIIYPQLNIIKNMSNAYAFMNELKSIDKKDKIYSEEFYFYKDKYDGQLIDMGDTVEAVNKTGYYGEDFNKTVNRNYETISLNLPQYILTGITPSEKLKKLIKEKYILYKEGPINLNTNYKSMQLWMRTY